MKSKLEPQLDTKMTQRLIFALSKIDNPLDIASFLRDLLTFEEIEEASKRFLIAELLTKGKTIRQIAKEIGVSTTTVTRINFWLHHGKGGYSLALEKLNN